MVAQQLSHRQLIIKIGQIGTGTQYCDYKKEKPKFNNIMIRKYVIIGITAQTAFFFKEIFVPAMFENSSSNRCGGAPYGDYVIP